MICSREGILEVIVNTSNSNNSLINSINFIVILNRLCNKNIDFRYAEANIPSFPYAGKIKLTYPNG